MKLAEVEHKENGIRLHRTNCDSLYRWSMWRMYLNEELSRVITARHDNQDYSHSLNSITAPYIRHPDGLKYGREMKRLYKRNIRHSGSEGDILPDNMYLVYGLPRVSLNKRIPDNVQKLHDSIHELDILHMQREKQSSDVAGADEEIIKLFDFVSSDETNHDNLQLVKHTEQAKAYQLGTNSSVIDTNRIMVQKTSASNTKEGSIVQTDLSKDDSIKADDKRDINLTTKSDRHIPPVSKSRLFWEKLANKKSEIIDLGREKPEIKENNEHAIISEEILQKQQKLLKKPIPKRTSRDLWRTLRERKTEILQLREMSSHQNNEQGNIKNPVRRRESKTSQLWGFIFNKKKELIHMKRGHKIPNDVDKTQNGHVRKELNSVPNDSKANISPRNFEDSFQKELAEKLRKRRDNLQSTSGNT